MKKFLVIGNPINHSLSPKLHNHWLKENNIDAVYEKLLLTESDIKEIISEIRNNKIQGVNVTVPFKISVKPFMDELTPLAKQTGSINTIYKKNNKIIGDNTDVGGFESAIKHIGYNVSGKRAFILGAGGVSPSIISALNKMGVAEIFLSNRTKEKAENLKKTYPNLKIINWGDTPKTDLIINATSLGLKKTDNIPIDYSKVSSQELFYDVIYNPERTQFLLEAKKLGKKIENGKIMFIYQAQLAFEIWNNLKPKIDKKIFNLLTNE